jgi:hypothetical protein
MARASRTAGSVTLCSSTGGLYVDQVEKQSVRAPLITCPATLRITRILKAFELHI